MIQKFGCLIMKRFAKYIHPLLILIVFESVAVTLWLTKNDLFYLFNFSYIGLSVSLGVANIPGLPDWMEKKVKACANANIETIRMAREAGIRIAFGSAYTNSRNSPYKYLGSEFRAMTKAGMTNMEAIRAGTINAAHLMLSEDETGSLEAGKLADIVIVEGDPLAEIECLTDADYVKLVMLDGSIKKNQINQ